ncbi:hypothetical protein ACIBG0_25160 [Nocardia sp. NPDC050630]|uniref:hypothetical protein n=1 Tax=Nocardia sp. NPDC050630 TaxID=3364321 RepID=UPI0037931E63
MPINIRVSDLIAAEERFDAAEKELREHSASEESSTFESIDKQGRKSLNVSGIYFERHEQLLHRVEKAYYDLAAIRRRFVEGV